MSEMKDNIGVVLVKENVKLIKKAGKKGDLIGKHNHEGCEVLFTVVKGRVDVRINDDEMYIAVPGSVVSFEGSHYLSATLLEDSEIFITLIKKL